MIKYEVPVVITKNGEMQFDLPENIQLEDVKSPKLVFEIEEIQAHNDESWGRQFVALLNSLDMSDWEVMDISDSVTWIKEIQSKEWASRWGES